MRPLFQFLLLLAMLKVSAQQQIITSDIDHFWEAYDRISQTKDSAAQYRLLNDLYISRATDGLQSLMRVRRYTPKMYVDAINNYPKFWQSIRSNTFRSKKLGKEINADIAKFQKIYPDLKPVPIYFAIGIFRTNGTIDGPKVLIGSEMALSDKTVVTDELPEHPKQFNKMYTPLDDIGLLCTHEYVHTQQKPLVDNLLSYCLYEGIAEFVSTLATGKTSNTPAVAYGKANLEKVRGQFEADVFIPSKTYQWLWSENTVFGQRDLGYSVGFEIAQNFYNAATDKQKAVQHMISLDYANETEVENFVDQSGYLSRPLETLLAEFENSRPYVTGVSPFANSQAIGAGDQTVVIHFSQPMDANSRGFEFGPLGEEHVLRVQEIIGFTPDRKSFSYKVKLEPKKRYQCVISNRFSAGGIPLKPYLIDITTD